MGNKDRVLPERRLIVPDGFVFRILPPDNEGFDIFYSGKLEESISYSDVCYIDNDGNINEKYMLDYSGDDVEEILKEGWYEFLQGNYLERFRLFTDSIEGEQLRNQLGIREYIWDSNHQGLIGFDEFKPK